MAKASAPISARLVATINARYYPVEGVADAYCLNGRFPGKREIRAVNVTLDRESRGFLVSLFGYPSDGRSQSPAWQEPLARLAEQVQSDKGDIDNDINDLAETAMDVTGRIQLGAESAREPYFSGILVRDGEIAAVTVGESLAFVYRHEALYPLTNSPKSLEPTDLYGDPVEGFEDFIAGEAGTIRYSNIAQIEQGDRLILCNSEVFDVVGQSQMMRYLEDADDSMDAAGLILTAAASQMPGTPMQVVVTEVVSVKEEEPTAARFSLGRFATQAMEPVVEPAQTGSDMDFARTQRYQKQDMVDMMKPLSASDEPPAADEWDRGEPSAPSEPEPFLFERQDMPLKESEPPLYAPFRGYEKEPDADAFDRYDDRESFEEDNRAAEHSKLPVFAYSSEAQRRRRAQYDDYNHQESWDTGDDLEDDRHYDPYADDDYEDPYEQRRPQRTSDRTRRIAFYAILIAIIVVCIIALIQLLVGGKNTEPTDSAADPGTTTLQSETAANPEQTTTTTPASTTTPTTVDTSGDTIYKVKSGDTLWSICQNHYGRVSENLCNKLAQYNGMRDMNQNIFGGQELKLPPLDKLLAE